MQFGVLGPLEVRGEDGEVLLGGHQQKVVLALLLANSGSVVSTDRLIDEIWGESPPASARKAVQSYVAQLRKAVNRTDEHIVGRTDGYFIEVEPEQVDSLVFETQIGAGREALGSDPVAARRLLASALELWRGAPYEGLVDRSALLRNDSVRLEELRAAGLEACIRADLMLGEAAGLVPDLEASITEFPLRERLRALLMVALYRAGRQADALAAYQTARRVMAEGLGLDPSSELRTLEQRILDQDKSLDAGDPFAPPTSDRPAEVRNPYKGLRAFEEADIADFFGRRSLTEHLLERLGRRDGSGRFLVLAGASGSGKSSVVRAGLIPAVREGRVPGLEQLPVITVYPGENPVASLDAALADHEPQVSLGDPLVVVVDQFEEVFALATLEAREAFLDRLAAGVTAPGGGTRVVATIRADYLDRPLQHAGFARLMQQGLELVPPLEEHEVRAAVTEPAALVGVTVEPELVAEVVQQVVSRPTALPLLQYALTDVFERRRGDELTLDAFQAAGGLLGALARQADDLIAVLDEDEVEAARQVFLRLVTISDDTEGLRRRVTRSELAELPIDNEVVDRVLERFGSSRLLTFDRDQITGQRTVEVPHESLIREWPRLRTWIDDGRHDLISHRRLATATAEWLTAGRDDSYAVRGARLAEFEALANSSVSLTRTETEFTETGRALVDAEDRARVRRRRTFVGVLVGATVVALALAGFALVQRGEANDRARDATARELAAAAVASLDTDPELSILLALEAVETTRAASGTVLRGAEEALHLAVLTNRILYTLDAGPGVAFSPDGTTLATADNSGSVRLRDAGTGEIRSELPGFDEVYSGDTYRPMLDLAFSADGSRLAASNAPGFNTGTGPGPWPTYVWEAATGRLLDVVYGSLFSVSGVALDEDGSLLATSSLDGGTRLWTVPQQPVAPTESSTAAGTPTGALVSDLAGLYLDPSGLATGQPPARGVAISPDGTLVAVAQARFIYLWDPASPTETPSILSAHFDDVVNVAFLADGALLASASRDGTARIYDTTTGATTQVLQHPAPVLGVAGSPDGSLLATGAEDGVVRVWLAETGTLVTSLTGHTRPVNHLSFSADGTKLAAGASPDYASALFTAADLGPTFIADGGLNGEIRVWDISKHGAREIATMPALGGESDVPLTGQALAHEIEIATRRAGDIEFSPDGSQLAVSEFDGSATIWSADGKVELAVLRGQTAPVIGISYSPDGTRVATVAPNGVRLWDARTGTLIHTLADNGESLRDRSLWFTDVAFSPSGDEVGAAQQIGNLTIWDAITGTVIDAIVVGKPTSFAFDPSDATVVAVTSGSGSPGRGAITIVDRAGGRRDLAFGDNVDKVSFNWDGSRLATVSRDGVATVWDMTAHELGDEPLFTMHSPSLIFRAVEYHPTGTSLATAGEDGAVRIWDAESGQQLLTLQPHQQAVVELAYSPDGTRLATISTDGTARILLLDIDELVKLARSRVTRTLTDEECQQYLRLETCDAR